MIDECAKRHPELGARLHSGERKCKDGVGRYAEFAAGRIYWHPRTGAHAIPVGPVGAAFDRRGYEWNLGYPVWEANLALREGGQCQAFEKGVLYLPPHGPAEGALIHGKIGARWAKENWENGPLGYPLADEQATGDGGRRQEFEHGSMLWHPSDAVEILAAR
ncbi:LGFP repeat-containing protein [Gordonia sp. (in: high G+C Gram-positive bacteria)]|uniref:LGFP repeat-containing protein n=1 Tax=Gordonia sp. (in: high G+C Gram-positive bacteria) TaxID=84139 RepID=UPI003C79426B